MKAINAFNFSRNDCHYEIECEHCGNKEIDKYGYNDEYYRVKVIPAKHCSKCGKDSKGELIPQPNYTPIP